MLKKNKEFLWSDKWSIEDGLAWFVPGNINILCSMNMETNHYEIITAFPDYLKEGFRLNSNCIKCFDSIFCMPNYEKCIWCYDLLVNEITKIDVANPDQAEAEIGDFWTDGNLLWAVSAGLKQIIEIDVIRKMVVGRYVITNQRGEKIAKSIKLGDLIYITSAKSGILYEFNIKTKKIIINELSMIKGGLRTIAENDGKFWLSGYKKEIYIWDKESNEIKVLNQFPDNFGIYNFRNKEKLFLDCEMTEFDTFIFLESINAGNYIWFIPFQTNQILYVNKDTYEINMFDIEEEKEDIKSIKCREMNCKYVLQYVYKDRYIGLYSLKNEMFFEIDAETLKIKRRLISLDTEDLEKVFSGWIFRESRSVERGLYWKLIKRNIENIDEEKAIGAEIYAVMR